VSSRVEDALIVGGGIAGLSAAIALGKRGVHTTVVESGDGAVGAAIGITYRAVYALDELGILDQVAACGDVVTASEDAQHRGVYTATGERLPFDRRPDVGKDWSLPVAIRLYRPVLAQIMGAAAREHGAEILLGHSYRSLELSDEAALVELTTGEERCVDLVIAADGIHSGLRTRFFPGAAEPTYTGSMSFRLMFGDAPESWRVGRHVADGATAQTVMLPDGFFYLAVPVRMERRHVEQAEARDIVRGVLDRYRPSEMFEQLSARLTDDMPVIVAPYESIFVEPPWHRGRVVLVGDAVHATAPTMGAAGGMAMEDGVVLAQELDAAENLDAGLTAYANRRRERARLVVENSAKLMNAHQQQWTMEEQYAVRDAAMQRLVAPY
jgi:2-polyprenyl-6-methoxyphenol hydroxylase-like FAD-dependent oxidoreductase